MTHVAGHDRSQTLLLPESLDEYAGPEKLVRDGKSISAVARTFEVHPATIYRVIEG